MVRRTSAPFRGTPWALSGGLWIPHAFRRPALASCAVLFHGTATRFLDAILKEGIKAGSRHHVHLSATYDTAITVGRRHGTPVALAVLARAMHHTGRTFYRADNGVWLTDQVPVAFIRRLSGPPDGAASPVVAAESRRSPRHSSS
jgi:RNA:NAD 2'-phosphotransferase (TPT1/KptA family)